ncbi:hypothetical protein M2337_001195 [Sphingobium sp. B2D3A]|uniref:hypothetical protein n=1 Tax=unclassified Sphingobium TaxID=2611147 RepID=UPI002224F6F3|nr:MULTISPECIES: hypothetical protein [unclassified Sphingobium]MCW2336962.1 hypothetical protein [Sphingobium sp. B2D3A]MCW2386715.1 hypothetical protein [Sphingobium sp. B2D3D]
MITPAPLIAAASRRLHHRTFRDSDGIRMVSQDGKRAFWLRPDQYRDLLSDYVQKFRPISKRTNWGFTLSIPVTILSLGLTHVWGLDVLLDRPGMAGFSFIWALIVLTWWPMLMVFYHWTAMRRISSNLEKRLHAFPTAPMPPARPVAFQTLEIVALFLLGPGLIINIIGSLFPHLFDQTPWMGQSVGLESIIGLIILAILIGRRLTKRRLARAPASAPAGSAPTEFSSPSGQAAPTSRVAKIAARARDQQVTD